jgi:hypothetical protein
VCVFRGGMGVAGAVLLLLPLQQLLQAMLFL